MKIELLLNARAAFYLSFIYPCKRKKYYYFLKEEGGTSGIKIIVVHSNS